MQQRLKSPPRSAGAGIVSAKFLNEVLATAHNPIATFYLRFGRESFTPLTTDLESIRIRGAYF
jgi:hypothetical protein